MTPLEALKILEAVTAAIDMNRAGHLKIIEALDVLKKALNGSN